MQSAAKRRQEVRGAAEAKGIAIATEGTVVTGAPVGTDEYINATLVVRVDDLMHDLAALQHCTTHGHWALLHVCVNQRSVYLQRLLGLQHGGWPSDGSTGPSRRRYWTSWECRCRASAKRCGSG